MKDAMEHIYLSLGSNRGDRLAYLRHGVEALRKTKGLYDVRVSSVYETEPWGYDEQQSFYNAAVSCYTNLQPQEVLNVCFRIETTGGRQRDEERRWGPRTLDIDVITYGSRTIDEPRLAIPHPRAHERAFVLVPIVELDVEAKIGDRKAVFWLDRLDAGTVNKLKFTL